MRNKIEKHEEQPTFAPFHERIDKTRSHQPIGLGMPGPIAMKQLCQQQFPLHSRRPSKKTLAPRTRRPSKKTPMMTGRPVGPRGPCEVLIPQALVVFHPTSFQPLLNRLRGRTAAGRYMVHIR